jgi:hypothetical protein
MMAIIRSERTRVRAGLFLAALVASCPGRAADAGGASTTAAGTLAVLDRTIVQERGNWRVDYRLRYADGPGQVLMPEDVAAVVDGWVSNSRADGHAAPRRSLLPLAVPSGLRATGDVIASDDEERRCRERATLQLWVEDVDGGPPRRVFTVKGDGSSDPEPEANPTGIRLAPGSVLRARLRLEHRHLVHGAYDPLLGRRTWELRLGHARLRDELPLDREQEVARPAPAALEVPDDRRDTAVFLSAPDSIHLAAHIPGNGFFRFPEIPVRHGARTRVRFSYLVAVGTEGTCRARLTQYKDSPIAWKLLGDGRREETLATVGRWTRVDLVFRTEPEATTLALDFRIEGSDVEAGELWIDDVSVEPVGAPSLEP